LLSRAHMKEIEKDKVKFGEAPKLVHFWISPYIFFLCFQLTLPFWLHPKFWPNSRWKPWVLTTLWITLNVFGIWRNFPYKVYVFIAWHMTNNLLTQFFQGVTKMVLDFFPSHEMA
jgi:hypothetical protein